MIPIILFDDHVWYACTEDYLETFINNYLNEHEKVETIIVIYNGERKATTRKDKWHWRKLEK